MDQKGRVLISRAYRADVPYSTNENFQDKILALDEIKAKPIIVDEENQVVYLHLRHQNLICKQTKTNQKSFTDGNKRRQHGDGLRLPLQAHRRS